MELAIKDIVPFSKNCRGLIAPFDVQSLADSMKEIGLKQPIVVRQKDGRYELIAGHRRLAAARYLKWETIPSIIDNMTDRQAQVFNLVENLQRKNLNILQEAYGVKFLKDQNMTNSEIASQLHVSAWWVKIRVELMKLPEEIQTDIAADLLTQQQIADVIELKERNAQFEMVKRIKAHKMAGLTFKGAFKKPSIHAKKVMKRDEILKMSGHILDHVGPCLTTRFAAWAAGEISTDEFFIDIKNEAGPNYTPPKEFPS